MSATEQLITAAPSFTPPKSEAGHQTAVELYRDLEQRQIGTAPGDQRYLGMPSNYRIPSARIYVINHSRTRKWKRMVVPVSTRRGAEEAILSDKGLKGMYTTELIYKQVEQGRDMNRYKEELWPVAFKLRVPGQSNQRGGCQPSYDRIILPADTADDKPLAYEVPEGTWDLYLGNYERMRGIVRDITSDKIIEQGNATVISTEAARLANYWSRRHNPVFRWTDSGESHDYLVGGKPNPFGFIEFVRVPVEMRVEPVDKEYLTALDIAEAS